LKLHDSTTAYAVKIIYLIYAATVYFTKFYGITKMNVGHTEDKGGPHVNCRLRTHATKALEDNNTRYLICILSFPCEELTQVHTDHKQIQQGRYNTVCMNRAHRYDIHICILRHRDNGPFLYSQNVTILLL
jgi:hypothetical protein